MQTRPTQRATTVLLILVGVQSALPRDAKAQAKCSDPSINNFVHPVGTKTAALGSLGNVEKRGHGPVPMILIPGAAFGWRIWEGFMDRNVDAYTMYAITPQGYDGSAPPPMPASTDLTDRPWTDSLCGAIMNLNEREKLERPLVVGHHSLGDHYAMRIAIDHPDKIRGVVVIAGSPSWAFAGYGNKSGTPVRLASQPFRERIVTTMMAPFYQTVTREMWRAGSWPPELFCNDKNTAERLFQAQVAVPIPTQVRYLLEYMTTDLSIAFAKVRVPVLIVQPEVVWSLNLALQRWKKSNEIMYGSLGAAKEQYGGTLEQYWGDVDAGVKWTFDGGYQWEQLRGMAPNMTIEYIKNSGIFVMEDQPEKLDAAIRAFVPRT